MEENQSADIPTVAEIGAHSNITGYIYCIPAFAITFFGGGTYDDFVKIATGTFQSSNWVIFSIFFYAILTPVFLWFFTVLIVRLMMIFSEYIWDTKGCDSGGLLSFKYQPFEKRHIVGIGLLSLFAAKITFSHVVPECRPGSFCEPENYVARLYVVAKRAGSTNSQGYRFPAEVVVERSWFGLYPSRACVQRIFFRNGGYLHPSENEQPSWADINDYGAFMDQNGGDWSILYLKETLLAAVSR